MQKLNQKLECQREQFSLPNNVHYLNCAYMSPLSKRVEAAGLEGVKRKSNPTQITPDDFFTEADQVRKHFAGLINASSKHVALIPAASYGVATVVKNLTVHAGQNVVLLDDQFPSNVYPWHNLREQDVSFRTVQAPDRSQRGEAWNAHILESISPSTAVVTLPHIHWTDGTVFDLETIGKRCREVGAALVIDATQSVGAMPFDVQRIQPDALIVGGYKTMMGPYGMGYAYYGERFIQGKPLEDNWIGRKNSEDFSRLVDYQDEYTPGAARFDVGERSNPILLPMMFAALEDVLDRQPQRIQDYCNDLTKSFTDNLLELGYQLEDSTYRAKHLFGIRLPNHVEVKALPEQLSKHNIFASVRGSALRVSTNVYNNEADLDALKEVLLELAS